MTTVAALADRCQILLSDTKEATWTQDVIESLVLEGIRDYSTYFQRHAQYLFWEDLSAGQQTFELPDDFREMLRVEFPINEDPPRYLKHRPITHPDFWTEPGYYDYHRQPDARTSDPANTLYISDDDLEVTQFLRITYSAAHDTDLGSTDAISVPIEHEHIIELFVVWKAMVERTTFYIRTPITEADVTIIQQMKLAAESAERSYRAAISAATARTNQGGYTGPWALDGHDRIY